MIILSSNTANTLSHQASDRSWVMFVQTSTGAIKIEGVSGARIVRRLREIEADNAHETYLIGLIETTNPDEDEAVLHTQFASALLHDSWFTASRELLLYVQQAAQPALHNLLATTHPSGMPDNVVDIDTIAAYLGVSVPTVRRLVKAGRIPHLRIGNALRFVPADVVESIQQRR